MFVEKLAINQPETDFLALHCKGQSVFNYQLGVQFALIRIPLHPPLTRCLTDILYRTEI